MLRRSLGVHLPVLAIHRVPDHVLLQQKVVVAVLIFLGEAARGRLRHLADRRRYHDLIRQCMAIVGKHVVLLRLLQPEIGQR